MDLEKKLRGKKKRYLFSDLHLIKKKGRELDKTEVLKFKNIVGHRPYRKK